MRINRHYGELQDSYLFSTIARRVADYQQAHPEADVIRLGIGDVTRPLCPAVTEALSAAVREMGEKAVAAAKEYVTEAIRRAPSIGHGFGPMDHFFAWTEEERL